MTISVYSEARVPPQKIALKCASGIVLLFISNARQKKTPLKFLRHPPFKGCQVCLSGPSRLMSGRPARSQSLCFTYEFVRQKSTFFILSTPPFDFERAGVCSSTVTFTQKCVKFVDFTDEARYFGNRVTISTPVTREKNRENGIFSR